MDAEELLEKYAAGTRQFHKGNRQGIDLKGCKSEEGKFHWCEYLWSKL